MYLYDRVNLGKTLQLISISTLLFISSIGCSKTEATNTNQILTAKLTENKKKWMEFKAGRNYTLEYRVGCFCYHNRFIVEVDGSTGQAISARGQSYSGVWEDFDSPEDYLTMDKIFQSLEDRLAGNPTKLTIEFDPVNGFISSFFIDGSHDIADDEFSYETVSITFN